MLRNHLDGAKNILKFNMEFNSGIIIVLPNVHTKVLLEPAGDKQTHVYGGLNTCGIVVSSNVPTYKVQHPIHIYTYIILVAK